MKIIHLIDYFQPKLGYQETFLAQAHTNSGNDVYVVTSDRYFPFLHYSQTYEALLGKRIVGKGRKIEEHLKTIRLGCVEVYNAPVIYLLGLKKVIAEVNPDIVICHGVFSLNSFQIAMIKRKNNFRLIYDNHTSDFNTDFNSSFFKRSYHFLFQKYLVPQIKRAGDKFIAIGLEEKKFLEREFDLMKSSISVIPLGVEMKRFKPNQGKNGTLRKKFGWKNNDLVLLYCGKIWPNKDVHILVEAICKIQNSKLKLCIIGGGDQKYINSLVKRLNADRISYQQLPFVSNEVLPNYYHMADIGIWPGNPSITFLEAMACGLPVILSEDKEKEYLKDSEAVVWFKKGNSDDLRNKISYLATNKNLREMYSRKCTQYITENLSWEKLAKSFLE